MKIKLRQGVPLVSVCTIMLLGMSEAFAFTSLGRQIDSECASLGYPLLAEYARDTCDAACHNNSQGESAFNSGNWEYFCPEPIVQGPTCTDADNDGFFAEGGVCGPSDFNDNDARAFPGAMEDCNDGVDNDGNGLTDASDPNALGCPVSCTDQDGDGYSADGGSCGPIDCNDLDQNINPGAEETCSDGIDNNCNGNIDSADMNAVGCPLTCTDMDGDGASIEGGACGAMDCDDNNDAVNPSALEICDDGIDNNCNNRADAQDAVCQSTDTGGDNTGGDSGGEDSQPWWRNRGKNSAWWRDRFSDRDDDNVDDDDDAGSDTSDDDDDASSSSDDDDDESSNRTRRSRSISRRSRDRDDD